MDNSNRQDARPDGSQLQVLPAHQARRWWVLVVIGVAQLMIVLDNNRTSVNQA
jgi:hypothetical protein